MDINFQKFLWKLYNFPIKIEFFFRTLFNCYPSWQEGEFLNNDWEETYSEDFHELDLDKWHKTLPGNWGSARPDNICVYTEDNIYCEDGILKIISKKEKATGKGWNGESLDREYTSGQLNSKFDVPMKPGYLYRSKIRCSNDLGSWKAYWLFKHDGERYQEFDVFEQFTDTKKRFNIWTTTVHWSDDIPHSPPQYMFNRDVTFKRNGEWLIFDAIIHEDGVEARINGVTVFISGIGAPRPTEKDMIIFSDAVTTHGGNVSISDINKGVPFLMEVDYFKIFKNKDLNRASV